MMFVSLVMLVSLVRVVRVTITWRILKVGRSVWLVMLGRQGRVGRSVIFGRQGRVGRSVRLWRSVIRFVTRSLVKLVMVGRGWSIPTER